MSGKSRREQIVDMNTGHTHGCYRAVNQKSIRECEMLVCVIVAYLLHLPDCIPHSSSGLSMCHVTRITARRFFEIFHKRTNSIQFCICKLTPMSWVDFTAGWSLLSRFTWTGSFSSQNFQLGIQTLVEWWWSENQCNVKFVYNEWTIRRVKCKLAFFKSGFLLWSVPVSGIIMTIYHMLDISELNQSEF